ncbi:MAG: putative zinc-binding metallopeptidase [Bacteroidota bacterium]
MKAIKIFLIISIIFLASCRKEDKLTDPGDIPGLGGDVTAKGPIDTWIYDSLTVPYNVTTKYKWDQGELDFNRLLVPPLEEKIIPVLSTIKRVWISNYTAEAGDIFMKRLCPKLFVLVGSPSFNPDGTVVLGSAEGGRQIILYAINYFRVKGMTGYVATDSFNVKEMMHTIEHEFGHILHQTVLYPADFKLICAGSYTSNWNNVPDGVAHQNGFVTAYAQASTDEDFVEMIATMLVEGKAGFDNLVNGITDTSPTGITAEQAQSRLRQKESIVVNYFKDVWNINFYSLQLRTRTSIDELIK